MCLAPWRCATALQNLRLSDCLISAAAVACCTPLAAVSQLQLHRCEALADDWEAALAALLCQMPLLSCLNVSECFRGELPSSLIAHSGLSQLELSRNGLSELPSGPYLASLQQLCLVEDLQRLPAALTAATALTSLEVRHRPHWPGAPLLPAGMGAVFAALPQLRQLLLHSCQLQSLPDDCWHGMAALTTLAVPFNCLTSLPAGLSHLTSLRQLDLMHNPQLAPTAEQLGALLAQLPLLELLELESVGLAQLPDNFPSGRLSK